MTRLDISRKHSKRGVAAKTATMSRIAIVLCVFASPNNNRHRTSGRCESPESTPTQRHPSSRRQLSRCSSCIVVHDHTFTTSPRCPYPQVSPLFTWARHHFCLIDERSSIQSNLFPKQCGTVITLSHSQWNDDDDQVSNHFCQ